jgi:simple sugar transport system permease protein
MSVQSPAEAELSGAGVALAPPRRLTRIVGRLELTLVPLGAILVSLVIFGVFVALVGVNPLAVYASIYKGAFGSWFSWQNTLQRAAPLILTALCTAIPARLGLIIIGGEGAFVVGALAAVAAAVLLAGAPYAVGLAGMMLAAIVMGGLWISLSGALRAYRGVNETRDWRKHRDLQHSPHGAD